MGSVDKYVCTLDEASLKKAREELNEDPADRMNAVEAFRNLIKTRAPHIRCSMGKCVCVSVCVCVYVCVQTEWMLLKRSEIGLNQDLHLIHGFGCYLLCFPCIIFNECTGKSIQVVPC